MFTLRIVITFLLVSLTTSAFSQTGKVAQLSNVAELREKLGLPIVSNAAQLANLKIAVFDYGFEGYDPKRECLPANTQIIEHYDIEWIKKHNLGNPSFQKGFEPGNAHGRLMAQAVWCLTGQKAEGPQFFLLNANGPTLFRRAIRYAIEQKVDVILFSGHFEGGGNYDGKGAINLAVNEAIREGIIWVNAAGNHHGLVYNGPVKISNEGTVLFGKAGGSSVLFFTNRVDENSVTITLTWNDYKEKEDAGTVKDLDLFVEDQNGVILAKSDLKQILANQETKEGESKNPRERVTISNLNKGSYRIRVVDKSHNFQESDRIRILLNPSRAEAFPHPDTNRMIKPIELTDATNDEELYPPADNPRVITVGDQSADSAMGPTTDRRVKPDLLLPALPAKWTNGEITGGTSYSAAFFAAIVLQLKSQRSDFSSDDLMKWFSQLRKQAALGKETRFYTGDKVIKTVKTPGNSKPMPANWKMPDLAEIEKLKNK